MQVKINNLTRKILLIKNMTLHTYEENSFGYLQVVFLKIDTVK